MANIYAVMYQRAKLAAAPTPGQGVTQKYAYIRDIQHAVVLAADNSYATISNVIKNDDPNYKAGEVIELLRTSQMHSASQDSMGVWQ